MVMIGGTDRDRIDMFMLLIQHFPPILIIFCFGKGQDAVRSTPVIHIAEKDDLRQAALIKIGYIALSLATHAHAGDDEFVAWSHKTPAAQDMSGQDQESRSARQSGL